MRRRSKTSPKLSGAKTARLRQLWKVTGLPLGCRRSTDGESPDLGVKLSGSMTEERATRHDAGDVGGTERSPVWTSPVEADSRHSTTCARTPPDRHVDPDRQATSS